MSVESILRAMAENSGRAKLQRGAMLGNTIAQLSQVPGQMIEDRQRAAVAQQQLQRQRWQDERVMAGDERQMRGDARDEAARVRAQQDDAIVNRVLADGIGEGGDPTGPLDARAALATLRTLGRPDLIDPVIAKHRAIARPEPKPPEIGTKEHEVLLRQQALMQPAPMAAGDYGPATPGMPAGQAALQAYDDQRAATTTPEKVTPHPLGGLGDYLQREADMRGIPTSKLTPADVLRAKTAFDAAGRAPLQPRRGSADAAGLVEAVIANPALFDQLTPSEKGRIAPALNAQGFGDFGKPVPPAAAKLIGESKSAIDGLKDLRQVVKDNEQYMGPIAGLSALNPYSDARKAQAKIDLVRQRVGKALEGGVLRKEDEEKYKIILAGMRDTPELAISKLDYLIENIERDVTNYTNELRLSGRRVNTDAAGRAAAPASPAAPTKRIVYDMHGNVVK